MRKLHLEEMDSFPSNQMGKVLDLARFEGRLSLGQFSVSRYGLEKLVLDAIKDQELTEELPWNLHTHGGAVYLPAPQVEYVINEDGDRVMVYLPSHHVSVSPAERDRLVKQYSRMGGWIREIKNHALLYEAVKRGQSHNGVLSPLCDFDLWKVIEKHQSPGALNRWIYKTRKEANAILAAIGVKVTWRVICKLMEKGGKPRRAGIMAAAAVRFNIAIDGDYSYVKARNAYTGDFTGCRFTDPCPGVERAIRVHKARLLLGKGLLEEIAGEISPGLASAVAPMRAKLWKTWRALKGHTLPLVEKPHAFVALCKILLALGPRANSIVSRIREGQFTLHDAGINLPEAPMEDTVAEWLVSQSATQYLQGVNIAHHYGRLVESGWMPYAANAVAAAMELLNTEGVEYAIYPGLARLALQYGIGELKYKVDLEPRWIAGLHAINHQTVPAPGAGKGIMLDGLHLTQLDKDDPEALFAGALVGCCQHPRGEAASSAWNAHESADAAIWAVKRKGVIIAQSWVWKTHDGKLVMDNIEAGRVSQNKDLIAMIETLYIEAAASVINVLGITEVWLGCGYGSVTMDGDITIVPATAPERCYTDAMHGWRIA